MNARTIFVATATCALSAGLVLGAPFAASAFDKVAIDSPTPVVLDFVAPVAPPEPQPAPKPLAAAPAEPKKELPLAAAPAEPKKELPLAAAPAEPKKDLPLADAPKDEPVKPDDKVGPNQPNGPQGPGDKVGPNQPNGPQGPGDKAGPNNGGNTGGDHGNPTADGLAFTGTEVATGGVLAALLAAGGLTLLAFTRKRRSAE